MIYQLFVVCNHSREVQTTKTLAAMLDDRIIILLLMVIQHGGDDVSWKRSKADMLNRNVLSLSVIT